MYGGCEREIERDVEVMEEEEKEWEEAEEEESVRECLISIRNEKECVVNKCGRERGGREQQKTSSSGEVCV